MTGDHELTFDRVEFFFGKKMMGPAMPQLPETPGNPMTEPVGATLVAARQPAQTDLQKVTRPVERLNYFLDDVPDNHGLGDVVVAVGFRGDVPVGIGELRHFDVRFDATYEYRIALAPYDPSKMEVWGRPDPDCVRWRDPDEGQVVILRAGDLDCDSFVDKNSDCAPLRYCDGTGRGGCIGAAACIVAAPKCEVGSCVNTDTGGMDPCQPSLCIHPNACVSCNSSDPFANELYCAIDLPSTHGADFLMHVHGDQTLCAQPQVILITPPAAVTCTNPKIEAVITSMVGVPSTFTFAIASTGPAGPCALTITPPMPGVPWPGIHHFLFSVDAPSLGLRHSFVFGLNAVSGGCGTQSADLSNDPAGTCN